MFARYATDMLMRGLPMLSAVLVFVMAAGPGLCAVACQLGVCPGCEPVQPVKACCDEKTEKAKCCEEKKSEQIEASASHKAQAKVATWVPVAVFEAPVPNNVALPLHSERLVANGERAPPRTPHTTSLSRGPPVR